MRLCLVTAFFLAGQAAAQGACPTRADLADGVTLSDTGRNLIRTHRIEDGMLVVHSEVQRDDYRVRYRDTYRHPLAMLDKLPELGANYVNPLAPLDALDERGEWRSRVTIMIARTAFERGEHTVTLTGTDQVTLDGCVYEVWRIEDKVSLSLRGDRSHTAERLYAPELGIVLAQSDRYRFGPEMSDAFVLNHIVREPFE